MSLNPGARSGEIKPGKQTQVIPPAPPWLDQFIQNQSREIDLRFKQVELEKHKQENWLDFSKTALAAQVEDRGEERVHGSTRFNKLIWLIGTIVFLILTFLGIVIVSGKEEVAIELIRVVVYGGAGYVGGWGIAQRNKNAPPPAQAPTHS